MSDSATIPPDELLREIAKLPASWGISGSFRPEVFARLAQHAQSRELHHTAETGTGKSTLLLSHLSRHHTVFTLEGDGQFDTLAGVRASSLLHPETVEFVLGPTQRTLPSFRFTAPLQLALIDGPHGFPFPHLEYFHLYPQLEPGALLIIDDIHLRSVNQLFAFVRDDAMFELIEVARTTAFFRRTSAPTFDPYGDGWWLQRYNQRWLPPLVGLPATEALKSLLPIALRRRLQRMADSLLSRSG